MAVRPLFEFPLSVYEPGVDLSLYPEDAKYLSVANPIGAAPGGEQAYHLAKWIYLEEGVYTITAFADDSATWWLGTDLLAMRIIGQHTIAEGTVIFQFYYPGGLQRLGITLHNLPAQATPCFVLYAISRDGQLVEASSGENWVFDTAPVVDEDLPTLSYMDQRQIVWTVMPNWKDGLVERLSWYTDVMESESGAEQRRAIRNYPRRSIEVSFLKTDEARSRMDIFFVGAGNDAFLVPLWHERITMVEGITVGASGVVLIDSYTSDRPFRKGDFVLVNNGDPHDYDILEVGDVEPARFSWVEPPQRPWPPGTRIYPCREARIIESAEVSNHTDRVGVVQVRFEFTEPDDVIATFGNPADELPYLDFRPNRSTPVRMDYSRKTYTLDNESSVAHITDVGGDARSSSRLSMRFYGRNSTMRFRRFIGAARGRAVAFYAQTYSHDAILKSNVGLGQEFIDIEPIGYYEYLARPQAIRMMLRFDTDDGVFYRNIVNVEPAYGPGGRVYGERLILNEAMPELQRSAVRRISFVSPVRFDQDSFELHHHSSNMGIVDTTVVVKHLYDRREAI